MSIEFSREKRRKSGLDGLFLSFLSSPKATFIRGCYALIIVACSIIRYVSSPLVLGIDPGLTRTALVIYNPDTDTIVSSHTARSSPDTEPDIRCAALRSDILTYLNSDSFPSSSISSINIEWHWSSIGAGLAQISYGIIVCCLTETLPDIPICNVPSTSWKKQACAKGNASKTEVRQIASRLSGFQYKTSQQDLADAYLIARYVPPV